MLIIRYFGMAVINRFSDGCKVLYIYREFALFFSSNCLQQKKRTDGIPNNDAGFVLMYN